MFDTDVVFLSSEHLIENLIRLSSMIVTRWSNFCGCISVVPYQKEKRSKIITLSHNFRFKTAVWNFFYICTNLAQMLRWGGGGDQINPLTGLLVFQAGRFALTSPG